MPPHTGNQISNEPLKIVVQDPVCKRKQAADVVDDCAGIGNIFAEEVDYSWLLFDIGVCAVNGKDRLSTCKLLVDSLVASLVAISEVDAQDFGQPMADLGPCVCHVVVFAEGPEIKEKECRKVQGQMAGEQMSCSM